MSVQVVKLERPNPRQEEFLKCEKKYVAFGGARGGGKSWAVRTKAVLMALKYPGIRILLVRRTMPELESNHLRFLRRQLAGVAEYKAVSRQLVFPGGSVLELGYCACDGDMDRYQGAEFDVICIDEATQLKEEWLRQFAACLRGVNEFPKRMYYMDQLSAKLTGEYVAASEFGTYVERLNAYLEANPEALTQYYSFFADLQASTETVSAAFEQYRLETEGYIRTGIVCYDGAVPQYGVAVGQNLICREVDGETVVEQNDFRATFTASKLSFWQDASEVAYVSNNRLYITNITVLEGMSIGEWEISSENGLVIRWMGG